MIDINDIRNGLFAISNMHDSFDLREVVILKVRRICRCMFDSSHLFPTDVQTPNHVLAVTDIPQRTERPLEVPEKVTYPKGARYTLQWLTNPEPIEILILPNNIDATFKQNNRKPKPSDLLLHYNYGAAVVRRWGHGEEVLQNRPDLPRPTELTPATMGPTRTHDRSTDTARHADEGGENVVAGGGPEEMLDLEEDQARWDEDDVMLFFWGNTQAAKERHAKKQEERIQYMEQWTQGVPPNASPSSTDM